MTQGLCHIRDVERLYHRTPGINLAARAALAYLAKHHIECTRADLVPILGLSRPESVPNLSARFATLLATDTHAKNELSALDVLLGLREVNSNSV